MKTINQEYTDAERKILVKALRKLAKSRALPAWNLQETQPVQVYIRSVLGGGAMPTFRNFLRAYNLYIGNYPNGGYAGYVRDALNRLADELSTTK